MTWTKLNRPATASSAAPAARHLREGQADAERGVDDNSLYGVAGLCWLPAVWIQLQMRNMAVETAIIRARCCQRVTGVTSAFWVVLRIPAFTSLVIVFYLMVAKPV